MANNLVFYVYSHKFGVNLKVYSSSRLASQGNRNPDGKSTGEGTFPFNLILTLFFNSRFAVG